MYRLEGAGRDFAEFVRKDVEERIVPMHTGTWIGCYEWRVDESGAVTCHPGNRNEIAALRLWDSRRIDALAPPQSRGGDGTMVMMYVRLEPSIFIEGQGRVSKVFNINNVGMHASLRGRGFFSAMLDALEAWKARDVPVCDCIMVQNISNDSLKANLAARPGWRSSNDGYDMVLV